MSYILDALRRAEVERGRGTVPDVHTLAAPVLGGFAGRRQPSVGRWMLALAAVAVLAAGGTWWVVQRQALVAGPGVTVAVAPAPASVVVTPPPAAPSALPAAPVVLPAEGSTPSVAVVAPAVVPVMVPGPAAVPVAPPAPAPLAERRAAPVVRERPTAPVVAAVAAGRKTAAEPAAPQPATSPVFTLVELPESVRTQLPALKVTGATHSNNPAHRMAIVNGQVLLEGEQAAPGLQLERIEPGRTVWSFRGYRYAVATQ